MWYEREIRRKIQRLAATFPAIVVTGARQVGKTTLLRRMYPDYHFVTLDRPAYAEMAETRPDDFLRQFQAPVIIDEVQYAPALFRHLKLLIDQDRENYGQYILTGSQKFTLMKAISDSLAGRCGVCELETLSLEEIRAKKNITLEEACLAGGYPELHKRPEIHYPDYFDAYLATYLERDVRTLLQVGNLRDFERFLQACALRTAQTVNKAELARDVGVSASTANQWLSLLHASNQVLLLEPWFSNKTKSLVKSPKLYIHDTGLLCHMLQISSIQELRDSPMWELSGRHLCFLS